MLAPNPPPPRCAGAPAPLLSVQALRISVGGRVLLDALSLALARGEFLAILGRNGCGKSLTLHTLAGLRPADSGQISLSGTPLAQLSRRQIARHLGLLPQDREESLPLPVLEATLIARHPHLAPWQAIGEHDTALARSALSRFGLSAVANRPVATLSGGEQRRAAMASLVTQSPGLYLLDEPSNHLDPHQQLDVLSLFRGLCAEGAGVIATLHDPALADRFADRVLLLQGDGQWQVGPTGAVLTAASLGTLYQRPFTELGAPGRRAFIAT